MFSPPPEQRSGEAEGERGEQGEEPGFGRGGGKWRRGSGDKAEFWAGDASLGAALNEAGFELAVGFAGVVGGALEAGEIGLGGDGVGPASFGEAKVVVKRGGTGTGGGGVGGGASGEAGELGGDGLVEHRELGSGADQRRIGGVEAFGELGDAAGEFGALGAQGTEAGSAGLAD